MIFIDTSAWIFLFDHRQNGKEALLARKFYQLNKQFSIVTDLIIEETHKWLTHHSFPKENAFKILEKFINEEFAKIIPIEIIDRSTAFFLVGKYLDQKLSYTDAITIAVMKRMRIKEIFSFDAHFDLFHGIIKKPDLRN